MKKIIIILLSIVIGAILVRFGVSQIGNFMQNKNAKNRPAPTVSIQEIQEKSVIRSFEAPGRVVSQY